MKEKEQIRVRSHIRSVLYRRAAEKKIPIHGTFELTPRCNMDCRMCYIHMSESEMRTMGREHTAEEWIEMGRNCREQGMLFLLLTGGEPFLRKDFRKIYESLSKMGLLIRINSNGTMITEETVEWLKAYPPSQINITLYGGSNDTYAKLCRNPRGFDQTVRAIDLLRNAGILVGINGTFTRYNIDDMPVVMKFAKERDIPVKGFPYMFPPMRNADNCFADDAVRFSAEEAGIAMFRQKKCQIPPEEFPKFLKRMKLGVPENTEEDCTLIPDEHLGCMAGSASFWITWDGRMTPCGVMNTPAARPFEEGFASSWKKIVEETHRLYLPAECTRCKKRYACQICGAIAMAEGNGDTTKKPEYLCKMTDAFLECCKEGYEKEST